MTHLPKIALTLVVGVVFLAASPSAQQSAPAGRTAEPANGSIVRTVSGVLECRSLDGDAPCGDETWTLTVQPDGTRTMRTFLDAGRDGQQINTIYRSDAAFGFIEAFSNVYDEGRLLGSGYYVADGAELRVATLGTAGFKAEQLPLPPKFSVLLHPPSLDGWHFGRYDVQAGGAQPVPTFVFGAVDGGPRLAAFPISLQFVGRETIKVPAGTFDTEHYHFGKDTDVWFTGPDRIMVRHEYRKAGTRYELARLDGPR